MSKKINDISVIIRIRMCINESIILGSGFITAIIEVDKYDIGKGPKIATSMLARSITILLKNGRVNNEKSTEKNIMIIIRFLSKIFPVYLKKENDYVEL